MSSTDDTIDPITVDEDNVDEFKDAPLDDTYGDVSEVDPIIDSFVKEAVTITKWGNKYSALKEPNPKEDAHWIEFKVITPKGRFTSEKNNKEEVVAFLKAQVEEVRKKTEEGEASMAGGKRKSKKQRKSRKSKAFKGGKSKKQRK